MEHVQECDLAILFSQHNHDRIDELDHSRIHEHKTNINMLHCILIVIIHVDWLYRASVRARGRIATRARNRSTQSVLGDDSGFDI